MIKHLIISSLVGAAFGLGILSTLFTCFLSEKVCYIYHRFARILGIISIICFMVAIILLLSIPEIANIVRL